MGALRDEGIDPEPWVRAQLELLAFTRETPSGGRNDRGAAQKVLDGMEYPPTYYFSAAAALIVELAARLGPIDEVLDDMAQDIAGRDW